MRLTKFTDLALRAVMRLAIVDTDNTAVTTGRIADSVDAPRSHMAKAVTRLRHLGVIETHRGRGGGLRLTDLGRTASIGWLVRQIEGEFATQECTGRDRCPLRGACRLRNALRDAQEAFYAALDPLTVADLVAPPTRQVLIGLIGRQPTRRAAERPATAPTNTHP